MQDVNNDMDDLFRQAAEHFPLQTTGADWEKVLAGLKEDDDAIPVAINNKQKHGKRALWLLLLLPLCLLYVPLRNHLSTRNSDAKTAQLSSLQNTEINKKSVQENTNQALHNLPNNTTDNRNKTPLNINDDSSNHIILNGSHAVQNFDANGNKQFKNTNAFLVTHARDKLLFGMPNKTGNSDETINEKTANKNSRQASGKDETAVKNYSIGKQPNETSSRIDSVTTKEETKEKSLQKEATASDTIAIKKTDSAIAKNDSVNNKKKKTAKPQMQWQKGFYGGFAGSFDVSTIKLQRINKTGYGLQVLAGYSFSKHLSVETGLGWSLKNYYSTGKYFDKKKAQIPNAVDIYYSNGECKMLDIPVNLKYDFAIHKKSNLFVTGGLSSYIMKKENYSYRGNYNMMRVYDTTRNYKNSGNNLLSVINFSIGYQWQLNKRSALRIEPYVKVPLHGIGIANMPITSAGISVGFTRKF